MFWNRSSARHLPDLYNGEGAFIAIWSVEEQGITNRTGTMFVLMIPRYPEHSREHLAPVLDAKLAYTLLAGIDKEHPKNFFRAFEGEDMRNVGPDDSTIRSPFK